MKITFRLCTILFFSASFAARAGDTNQIAAPVQAPVTTRHATANTNIPPAVLAVLKTFDMQITDLNVEIQQVKDRQAAFEKKFAQQRSLGLSLDPNDEANYSRLDGSMNLLTNQLQMWRQKRELYFREHGHPLTGPRPTQPNDSH